jgi:hypothetical protein
MPEWFVVSAMLWSALPFQLDTQWVHVIRRGRDSASAKKIR